MSSLMVLMIVIVFGASVGALAAHGPALWLRLMFAYDVWRARKTCEAYLREVMPSTTAEADTITDTRSPA